LTSQPTSRNSDLRFKQATHNNEVAYILLSNKKGVEAWDWVITTTFYSVVHYVESVIDHKSTSLKIDGLSYTKKSVSELMKSADIKEVYTSIHGLRKSIVSQNFGHLFDSYKEIFDACHTARYTNYQLYNRAFAEDLFEQLAIFRLWSSKIIFPKKNDSEHILKF